MPKKKRKVKIILDGELQEFKIKKSGEIFQNEGLFTSEFVEAVRKLRRWPRADEVIGETRNGTPCFRKIE